jgi:hypothetical protein
MLFWSLVRPGFPDPALSSRNLYLPPKMQVRAYTPLDLERVLAERVAVWTQDFRLFSPIDEGAVPVPLEVVTGYLPSFQSGPDAPEQERAPVVAIRATAGSYRRHEGHAQVHLFIICWDNHLDRKGYQDCANVTMAIVNGLLSEVVVGGHFPLLDEDISWAQVDDPRVDFFPYFLAGVTAHFGLQSPSPSAQQDAYDGMFVPWLPQQEVGYSYNPSGEGSAVIVESSS